jgi:hypothetical protein
MRYVNVALLAGLVAVGAGCGGVGTLPPSSDATLAALTVSAGTLAPAFDPGTLDYAVGPGGLLGVDSLTVTPTANDAGATIAVDGTPTASAAASAPCALVVGSTVIDVVVTAADATTKTYTVVFVRGPTGQEAYVKASNTGADDRFGKSAAISGDTLVVGARYEDSSATGIDGNQADNGASQSGAAYVFR